MSSGIEEIGHINWHLILSLLGAWVVVGLCIVKGVKSVGKVGITCINVHAIWKCHFIKIASIFYMHQLVHAMTLRLSIYKTSESVYGIVYNYVNTMQAIPCNINWKLKSGIVQGSRPKLIRSKLGRGVSIQYVKQPPSAVVCLIALETPDMAVNEAFTKSDFFKHLCVIDVCIVKKVLWQTSCTS